MSEDKEKGREVKFEITEHLGELSVSQSSGWIRELNLVSWNDRPPKYDIRDWEPSHERMKKGLTFTEQEVVNLKEILNELDI
jgi:hypothetical protein